MKQSFFIKVFLVIVSSVVSLNAFCDDYDIINHLQAGTDICVPVVVKCNLGTFYVYHEESIVYGNIYSIEAYDCSGRKIIDLDPDRYDMGTEKPLHRWYIFSTLYPTSSDSQYDKDYSSAESAADATFAGVRSVMGNFGSDVGMRIQGGVSRAWGEFGRIKFEFGSDDNHGGTIFGGLGKDVVWKMDNKDKLLWHAGLGLFFGDDEQVNNLTISFIYGETSIKENKALILDATYLLSFGPQRRFSLLAGAGFGLGNFNEDVKDYFYDHRYFLWDITGGISIRLF